MTDDNNRKSFHLWTRDPFIKKVLEEKEDISKYLEKLVRDHATGELVDINSIPKQTAETSRDLDNRYKQLRNRKLELDIELKERELTYYNTFNRPPTAEAKKAMDEGIKKQTVWTGPKYEEMIQQAAPDPELSEGDWSLIFPCFTEWNEARKMFMCVKCKMGVAQTVRSAREHLMNEHEAELQQALKEMR